MVGSFYDPELDEGCAFEELISLPRRARRPADAAVHPPPAATSSSDRADHRRRGSPRRARRTGVRLSTARDPRLVPHSAACSVEAGYKRPQRSSPPARGGTQPGGRRRGSRPCDVAGLAIRHVCGARRGWPAAAQWRGFGALAAAGLQGSFDSDSVSVFRARPVVGKSTWRRTTRLDVGTPPRRGSRPGGAVASSGKVCTVATCPARG